MPQFKSAPSPARKVSEQMTTVPEDTCSTCGKSLDDEDAVFSKIQQAIEDCLPETAVPALADAVAFQLLDCDEPDGAFIAFLEELTDKYRFYKEQQGEEGDDEEQPAPLTDSDSDKALHYACNETMRRVKNKPAIQAVIGQYTDGSVSTIPEEQRTEFLQKLAQLMPSPRTDNLTKVVGIMS
jgi:hypothetical protein